MNEILFIEMSTSELSFKCSLNPSQWNGVLWLQQSMSVIIKVAS